MKIHLPSFQFPFYKQLDAMDCGPTCLRMVAQYHGKSYSLQTLREKSYVTREGVSLLGMNEAAETIGMRTLSVRIPYEKLDHMPLPCIAHWRNNHFVVIHKLKKNKVHVADPAHGLLTYSKEEFLKGWQKKEKGDEGILLLLEPTPQFYLKQDESRQNIISIEFLLAYLLQHRRALAYIVFLMGLGIALQFALPFLTQAVVDLGIANQNLNFVYAVLVAQFMLFVGQTVSDFMRSRLLLRVSTRINISIISDFLVKLMKLPLSFFDTKVIGDLLQRINDHYRIETFITTTTLGMLFSAVTFLAFGVALLWQSGPIFLVFLAGSLLYITWISFFMKRRRELDFKRFEQLSDNQSTLIQLIRGMPEIKLNNAEKQKQGEWQQIQETLFKVNIDSMILGQYQQGGGEFINQLKNIVIAFLAARSVILGEITLGNMMAIQLIVGQLNGPVTQLLGFVRAAQDARISLERLSEIHDKDDEDRDGAGITRLPPDNHLHIRNLSFQYEGPHSPYVFKNLSLHIPAGKVTAVVGPSGSGKTTLLKLLLKFYQPAAGEIRLGDSILSDLDSKVWRQQCGVVMQDGYIFSDTIERNIALSDDEADYHKLCYATQVANISEFIESLPLGYETKIGQDGHGLSQGQQQRILIARAVYKNPAYLMLDEATNALDASNERSIMEHLESFFEGKTVIVIAHRLSTVKKADQIVVMDKGCIVEMGSHAELIALKGAYYHLVKDQLELGQ
jgi:ATP-binding cassette subfamily B protein